MVLQIHLSTIFNVLLLTTFFLPPFLPKSYSSKICVSSTPKFDDNDLLELPLNLEYLEAEVFMYGSLGYGLDIVDPNLVQGGPSPIGAKMAKLNQFTKDVILHFGLQEVGHLSHIENSKGFLRPLLNLSSEAFATIMDNAFGKHLNPPFDPYANSINYLLASNVIPYVGLTGYVGANPKLQNATSKELVVGLLAVESGQDAVIRALLYERRALPVYPYGVNVAEFTNRISKLVKLGKKGLKHEGPVVPKVEGAEGKVTGNILSTDTNSVAYSRTPQEILRIVYSSGSEHIPGGFHPKGGDGRIAKFFLVKRN